MENSKQVVPAAGGPLGTSGSGELFRQQVGSVAAVDEARVPIETMTQEDIAEYISDALIGLYDIAQRSGMTDIGAVLKTAGLLAQMKMAKR